MIHYDINTEKSKVSKIALLSIPVLFASDAKKEITILGEVFVLDEVEGEDKDDYLFAHYSHK